MQLNCIASDRQLLDYNRQLKKLVTGSVFFNIFYGEFSMKNE